MITEDDLENLKKELFYESDIVIGSNMIEIDAAMDIIKHYFDDRGLLDKPRPIEN